MLCFRGKTYCAAAMECANRRECGRWFNANEAREAEQWWGANQGDPPVSCSDFRHTCPLWAPVDELRDA